MKKKLPFYAEDNKIRTILYSDMKNNNSNYSAADICFVCDTTGSMDRYITSIIDILIKFLNTVTTLINNKPRVAFIGYKDKDDNDKIKSKGFTTKYEEMIAFITEIECGGGSDKCEDIVTPLMEALKLDWSSDLNYLYLITDSPTHGKRYHKDDCPDDYPDDDKDKLLEKLASHYRRSKINLTILRCNDSVDEMIKIIKENYDSYASRLNVIDINDKDSLEEDFKKHFFINLEHSMKLSFIGSRNRNYRKITKKDLGSEEILAEYEMEYGIPFTGKLNIGSIKNLAFDKRKYEYSIEVKPSAELKCKISGVHVSSGILVNCYPLQVGEDNDYVAKLPKRIVIEARELFPDIEGTLLTKVLADKFNFHLRQAEKEDEGNQTKYKPISVLSLNIIENLDSEKSKKPRFFLTQQFLEGEYVKFNNNYGWINEDEDSCNLIAQAFSHFTYEYTTGVIMVTDIQGIKNKTGGISITDPAIHSFFYNQRFGKTNHGKLGMIRFFMTHKCNDYCKKLYLMNPTPIDDATVQSIKEERKGGKPLSHLYKKFEPNIQKWREKIQSFDQDLDPESDPTKESDEDCSEVGSKYTVKPT